MRKSYFDFRTELRNFRSIESNDNKVTRLENRTRAIAVFLPEDALINRQQRDRQDRLSDVHHPRDQNITPDRILTFAADFPLSPTSSGALSGLTTDFLRLKTCLLGAFAVKIYSVSKLSGGGVRARTRVLLLNQRSAISEHSDGMAKIK